MSKPLAYSYVRMSTDIQLKGDSLRRQTELSKKYADENGLELVEDFNLSDIGVSAFRGANVTDGNLGKFIKAVENGEIRKGSYLLVESLDRLTRQKLNAAQLLFMRITAAGINIVTLADKQVYKAGEQDLGQMIVSLVIMSRAFEESEMKSQRLSAVWENKRRNIADRVLTKHCPAWLKISDDKTKYVPISARVKVVKSIFEWAANGHGSHLITRKLNSTNVEPFGRSSGWVESYVTKILLNRAVLGEFQPHTKEAGKRVPIGPVVEGYFPQIIDEKLFLRVRLERKKRKTSGSGRVGYKCSNLFTHLVKCSRCGWPMRFVNKGKPPKGGTYLTCSKALSGQNCRSKTWSYSDFETSFFHLVHEIDLQAILDGTKKLSLAASVRDEIEVTQERMADLIDKRENTYQLVVGKTKTDGFLREKLDELSIQIEVCENTISELGKKLETASANIGKASNDGLDWLEIIRDQNSQDLLEKRVLVASKLKDLIGTIRVDTVGKVVDKEAMIERAKLDGMPDELMDAYKMHIESQDYSAFEGPSFVVHFHEATVVQVFPSQHNPTQLNLRTDFKENMFAWASQDEKFYLDDKRVEETRRLLIDLN